MHMTVSLSSGEAALLASIWPILLNGAAASYIHVSAIALLFYDTFLTMDREVRHIWSRRHASTTAMYIVARYSAMLTHLVILLIATRWSGQNIQTCTALYWIGSLSNALSLLAIACFSAVRVFVLSGKNYWQPLVVLVFGLYLSAMYLYFPTVTTSMNDPQFGGCSYGLTLPMAVYRMMGMSTRVASIAADLPALLVTLRHTYRTFMSGRQSLSQIMLVDGSIYFGALFLLNLVEIIFLVLAIPHAPEHDLEAVLDSYFVSVSEALADFATTLNVVLMCRFLLDLCEAGEAGSNPSTPSAFTSVLFTSRMLIAYEDMSHPNHTPKGHSLTAQLSDDNRELVEFERRTIPLA